MNHRDIRPCRLCGYDRPGSPGSHCPHCKGEPREPSLARSPSGPLASVIDGLLAVPMGLRYLVLTRGVKRWLLPPMLLAVVAFLLLWWGLTALIGGAIAATGASELSSEALRWEWLEGLGRGWGWLQSVWSGVAGVLAWIVNQGMAAATGGVMRFLVALFFISLFAWYLFSVAYEAFAGPFLDEIQGILETNWFGADPRKALQRPTDLPVRRCVSLSLLAVGGVVLLLVLGIVVPFFPFLLALLLTPIPIGIAVRREPEYGKWLRWVASIEGRALWVGIKASIASGVIIVLAVPLYFVLPPFGPALFAAIVGFATAISLLDIPFERRQWSLRDRLGFVGRNLPAMVAFGTTAGFLLAVPIVGWLLMVPAASIGGLWLICRLDTSLPRQRGTGVE